MNTYFLQQKEAGISMSIISLKKILLIPLFTLFAISIGTAQVVIAEVFPNGTFELENNNTSAINVSSYWICSFPSYTQLGDLSVECGSLTLQPGESVTISGFNSYKTDDDELGLYTTENGFRIESRGIEYRLQMTKFGHF